MQLHVGSSLDTLPTLPPLLPLLRLPWAPAATLAHALLLILRLPIGLLVLLQPLLVDLLLQHKMSTGDNFCKLSRQLPKGPGTFLGSSRQEPGQELAH